MVSKGLVEIVDNILMSTIKCEPQHNSFFEVIFEVLHENRSKVVMIDDDCDRRWTGNELIDAIVTLGVKLHQNGVSKGDIVAFFCPNSDLHAIAMLSVCSIGAVYTGLVDKSPLRELNNVIVKTNATYLVGSKETIDVCKEFMSTNKTIKKFFVINECNDANTQSIYSLIKSEIRNEEREMFYELMSKLKSTDLWKVAFSSGTSGEPKAVTMKHRRFNYRGKFSPHEISVVTNLDICALMQPLTHVGGTVVLIISLLKGATVVIFSHFDCDNFIKDIQKHGITYAFLVPAYLNLLNRSVSEPLTSFSLKKVVTVGEFAQEIVCKEFIEKFNPEYFAQSYGATEAGMVTFMPISDGVNNLKSVGVPSPGYEIKIIDPENGNVLVANKVGEICVRRPGKAEYYLNNEKANRESFDEQLFFKSGDIGYFDENGYLYVTDRIKEIIKYNSQQVSPNELENILLQHESVKEAAVVGVPDDVYGQLPKAFVVLKEEFQDKTQEKELMEFVNTRVIDFKKLRGGLIFMSELPKSRIGKIERRTLKSI